MDDQTPRKRSIVRRVARAVALVLLLGVVVLGAIPWLLSTPPARDAFVAAVNQRIAPSRFGLGGLSVSWAGSIRLSGVSLRYKHGKTLVTARQAVLDRGLLALALDRSRLGTLTVDGAVVDVERAADGVIDLVDALLPAAGRRVRAGGSRTHPRPPARGGPRPRRAGDGPDGPGRPGHDPGDHAGAVRGVHGGPGRRPGPAAVGARPEAELEGQGWRSRPGGRPRRRSASTASSTTGPPPPPT